jgi:hypothetical protein
LSWPVTPEFLKVRPEWRSLLFTVHVALSGKHWLIIRDTFVVP